jgi:hypothetical protein
VAFFNAGDEIQLICAYFLGNKIGAEGGCVLAESLKQNTNLIQLNLNCKYVTVLMQVMRFS